MSLKDFSLEQMIASSSIWFDPRTQAHKALYSIESAKSFVTVMATRHDTLVQIPQADSDQAIQRLTSSLAEVNSRHANLGRGLYKNLESLRELATEFKRKALYNDLIDLLFPNGLKAAIQSDFTAESGAGALLAQRLDAPTRELLRALPLPVDEGGNLEVVTDQWVAAAAELGALEHQRAVTERAKNPDAKPVNVRAEMFAWIKAVKTLKSIVKQADVSQETWATIFGDLEAEERSAKKPAAKPPVKPAAEPSP